MSLNPDLLAQVNARFPLASPVAADQTAMGKLGDGVAGLAGGGEDGITYTAGVAAVLRWLATGTTDSEPLAVIISATDAP